MVNPLSHRLAASVVDSALPVLVRPSSRPSRSS